MKSNWICIFHISFALPLSPFAHLRWRPASDLLIIEAYLSCKMLNMVARIYFGIAILSSRKPYRTKVTDYAGASQILDYFGNILCCCCSRHTKVSKKIASLVVSVANGCMSAENCFQFLLQLALSLSRCLLPLLLLCMILF